MSKHMYRYGLYLLMLAMTSAYGPSAAPILKQYTGKYVMVKSYNSNKVLTALGNGQVELRRQDPGQIENQALMLKNVYDPKGNPVFYLSKDDSLGVYATADGFNLQVSKEKEQENMGFLFTGDMVSKEDSTRFRLYRPVTLNDFIERIAEKNNEEIPSVWTAQGDRVFLGTSENNNSSIPRNAEWSVVLFDGIPYNFSKSQKELAEKRQRERIQMDTDTTYFLSNRWTDDVVTFSGTAKNWQTQPDLQPQKGAEFYKIKDRILTQQFRFEEKGDKTYSIVNVASGAYLTFKGLQTPEGIPLYENEYDENANQKFVVEWSSISRGYKKIRAVNANLYLGVVRVDNKYKLMMVPEERSEFQEFDIFEAGLFSTNFGPGGYAFDLDPKYITYVCSGIGEKEVNENRFGTALIDMNVRYEQFRKTDEYQYRRVSGGMDSYVKSFSLESVKKCFRTNGPHKHKINIQMGSKFSSIKFDRIAWSPARVEKGSFKLFGRPKTRNYKQIRGKPVGAPLDLRSCEKICWRKIGKPEPEGMVGFGMLYGKNNTLLDRQIAVQGKAVMDFVASIAMGVLAGMSGGGGSATFRIVKKMATESEYYLNIGANAVIEKNTDGMISGGINYLNEYLARETELPQEMFDHLATYDPTGFYSMAQAFILPFCDECD